MPGPLAGRVAAVLCAGTDLDRAIAMALAEAGADIAIGTLERDEEFATASIANEVWAVGREQFSSVVDATDAVALASFAAETADRLGRCDVLVVSPPARAGLGALPPEEVSAEEWAMAVRNGLTIPFLAAHAFQPVIERDGGGLIMFVDDGPGLVDGVMLAGRAELAAQMNAAWLERGVRVVLLSATGAAVEIVRLAARR
ncbi:MAG: SDR family oxidoreductase [Anaerolineaceae bacterium]